ncbi:sphingolipid C9-methyltransferase [Pseudohyphozyma bogoriensis]|nr:sphingolipid C9-methyltransferase [Pseudohyphozyma bogoriensis]
MESCLEVKVDVKCAVGVSGVSAAWNEKTGIKTTSTPTLHNAPLPIESNGTFSNFQLAFVVLVVPYLLTKILWIPYFSWTTKFVFLLLVTGAPVTVAYWMGMSRLSFRVRENGILPGKPIEEYLDIKDPELKAKYNSTTGVKIPHQIFYDAYFEGKIDVKGDLLEIMEYRHDWSAFIMTPNLMKYVFTNLIPEVIVHSQSQDEEQVRDHYDRGDDFYSWFLGPRMIYTSGVINDITRKETLEELQDNKLALVCKKLELKPTDTLLDIGCGWGTLCAYANKNFECDVTGVTLGKNQTIFGNKRIKDNGCNVDKARILCQDYREIGQKKFSKIVSLEMAEHVGIRNYGGFMRQVYDLLEDDGIFVYQVSGFRPCWQYEDLIWGLFMNKYVFPGADASCALNWHLSKIENAGFEVKSIDVLGVHYSATLWRWYENWKSNEEHVVAKYGKKWYLTWLYFLASATIASRQGSASIFQMVLHKNLNQYHRVDGVPSHTSLHFKPEKEPILIV